MRDFNPNYSINRYQIDVPGSLSKEVIDKEWIKDLLIELDVEEEYKQSYYPEPNRLKVFLKNGNMELDIETGKGLLETVHKRPVLYQVNFLHYNPGRWWKWFSDIFCISWIIRKRGALWTIAGIIIPIILLLVYG